MCSSGADAFQGYSPVHEVFHVCGSSTTNRYNSVLASLAIGILMDAFGVRTLLVPAPVALLGRWNWWPSTHGTPAQAAPEPEPAPALCR